MSDDKTVTFVTEHGPKTYTADELEALLGCYGQAEVCASKLSEPWLAVTESRPDFVRKLYKLYCTEPGDEPVREIAGALRAIDPDDDRGPHVRLYATRTHGCCDADIKHARHEKSNDAVRDGESILATIRSLAKPEPTMPEVFGEMADFLRRMRALDMSWDVGLLGQLIAKAEKLLEADK